MMELVRLRSLLITTLSGNSDTVRKHSIFGLSVETSPTMSPKKSTAPSSRILIRLSSWVPPNSSQVSRLILITMLPAHLVSSLTQRLWILRIMLIKILSRSHQQTARLLLSLDSLSSLIRRVSQMSAIPPDSSTQPSLTRRTRPARSRSTL